MMGAEATDAQLRWASHGLAVSHCGRESKYGWLRGGRTTVSLQAQRIGVPRFIAQWLWLRGLATIWIWSSPGRQREADQTFRSWNPFISWLRKIVELQSAA
jgi:hypothetical protein